MKVAIIGGTGKMGRWFANLLLKDGKDVLITGRSEQKLLEVKEQLNVETSTSIAAVKSADVVIISVPIDTFEAVVKELQPHIHPEQIILDVTSIKVSPVDIMHRYLKSASVLGTHPVFGPGARDLVNKNFVLTPTNEKEQALAEKVRQYLEKLGASVSLMPPQEHDKMMAVVLGLSHFIAIVAADTLLGLGKLKTMGDIGGSTYKLLRTLAESVVSEDAEFYASLQMNLPGLTEMQELFQKNSATWADMVKNKDRSEFAKKMNSLRTSLEKSDPDFHKAYENMYKLLD
ncbi:MAG: prephenate dehydrogenase [Dehalococcoidales bacterium]|nr:prephenate dehydrogenase [Dehalococcoidales bacterium]